MLSTTAVLNVIQNSSANLPFFPPDKHHDLDSVHWKKRVVKKLADEFTHRDNSFT